MLKKDYSVSIEDRTFIYNELYNEKKDRSYWFYLRRFADESFCELIKNDVNQLNLNYSGDEFIKLILKNIENI